MGEGTSVGRYVKAAIDAISSIPGLRYEVTPMATVLEAEKLATILRAAEEGHRAVEAMGARRISSMLRIDQRFDKPRKMLDKVSSVRARQR